MNTNCNYNQPENMPEQSLAALRPDLAAEWDYEKNGNLTPDHVSVHSYKKVWWKCRKCGQSWQATINNRTYGFGCPYCASKLPVMGKTNLAALHPNLAAEWDYEKNGSFMPSQVTALSTKKVRWKCYNCEQRGQATINSRTNRLGCPYCAGQLPVPGKTDLATLRPDLAAEWDHERNGVLKPEQFTSHSAKKIWWKCSKCGQSWQGTINSRTNRVGCPYCAGQQPVPGKTDLATLRPDLTAEWDYDRNGELRPEQVSLTSNKQVWWKCSKCGRNWKISIRNRVRHSNCLYGC
jgi:DNA-directed RNA polymerase subunit RPC12/RpoP